MMLVAGTHGATQIDVKDDGVRIGTNEFVRWGAVADDMAELASLIARGLTEDPVSVAPDVSVFRQRFDEIGYTVG